MIRLFLKPLPALVAALLAILLAVLYLDHGWRWPVFSALAAVALIFGLFGSGRWAFTRRPYHAGFVMEAGLGLLTLGAGIAGAVLLWLAIQKAPGEHASTRQKEVWAALSVAITTYLGSIIIKPEGEIWNPVKTAIKKKFADQFTARQTLLEKDARNAVQTESYGAEAPSHAGQVVEGWGWDARRLRTRHIQDQLNVPRS